MPPARTDKPPADIAPPKSLDNWENVQALHWTMECCMLMAPPPSETEGAVNVQPLNVTALRQIRTLGKR
jgi:hypothetical protein